MTFSITRLFIGILIVLCCAQNVSALKLKIGTLSPEGSMWMQKMREGATQIAKQTNNRVTFKFYTSNSMGNDKTILRKIKFGQLQGGAVVGGSLSGFFPANQIYAQPMKFKNLDEVDYVRKHIDSFVVEGLEDAGFITFGLIGGGFAYIMSKEPIETVQDLRAQKVWIPDNDKISQDSIRAFGLSPIPLPIADVRTSLQSGLINTVATSPLGALFLQWHTQIKYVTNIPLIYLHAVLAIEKKSFLKISQEDRKIVTQIMTQALKELEAQNRIEDIKVIQILKKRGIIFINPSETARKEWYNVANEASRKMIQSGVIPKDIVEKMDGLLKEFHSKNQVSNPEI